MKKPISHLFLGVFILMFFQGVNLYAQEVKFRHLTIDDGLSQNAVFSILQDSRGFMWFGTKDGLNRYDGRNFVTYQHNPFDSTTISNPYVTTLYEDSRGWIWAGTLNGDVNIYDKESEFFQKLSLETTNTKSLSSNTITAITESPDGKIWIGTHGGGLMQVTPGLKGDFEPYSLLHDPSDNKSLSHNIILDLLIDKDGILWIATENGLNKFEESGNTFTNFLFETKNPYAPNSSGEYRIGVIHEGKNDELWLGTQSGLVNFDRKTGDFQYYPNRYEVFRYGWGSVNHIVEDSNGLLWLGTSAGLLQFDRSTNEYKYHQHDPLNPNSLSFNIISSMAIDQTGILWIGTTGQGINILDFNANRFPILARHPDPDSRITGFSIRSIFEDNSGDVWISADVLYRWNRETGELKSFETSSNRPDDFGNTDVYSMIQATDGYLWAASARGLFRHNPASNETRLYMHNLEDTDGQFYPDVYAVFEDQDSTIWIATRNHFSKLIDKEEGRFKHFDFSNPQSSIITTRPVIFQDMDGIFWLGTADGLIRFDSKNESFIRYRNDPAKTNSLSNNHIKSILADPVQPETYLWIGTSGGLNKFDYRAGTFGHYTEQDGLPNEVVYGILPDNVQNLWLSTNKGLSRFNPKAETFRNFDVRDGLQSNEFNTGAYFRSESGELFFGGIQGLNYFYPGDIRDNPHEPPVVLTGLKIGNESITYKSNPDLLEASVGEMKALRLSHKDDVVTFEFAALDYSAPDKNQYAYRLDGYNEDWISSGNLGSATYTNLPHGEYTFRVKGSNNDGVWNEEGLALAVIVTPPWWQTWWAYGFYAALFLSILYGARRYELNRFNLKNQLEIEKIQTDTLRNLDQLKSHFFANISHEFRTPLTLIIGQIENLLDSDINGKKKKKLQSVNKNAERLLTLINQLLDLSKLEAGKMELQSEQLNIVSFLKNLLFSFESLAESKNIALNFSSPLAGILVDFDANKMEKVFFNLFSNAFKFTQPGGRIDVALEIPETGFIEISIKDSGVGIPKGFLPHIFDRFYQADPSNTRKYEGTGIGLSLANEMVKLHQGTITVFSEEGSGTEFIVRLPLDDSTIQLHKTNELIGETMNQSEAAGLSLPDFGYLLSELDEIILVVEDNADMRSFIREQFAEDYKVIEASNGKEGIAISRRTIPDLIITDLMMPEMDGYQFCEEVRRDEKTSHIPIIMLTAKAGVDPKIEGLEAGIDAYVTKPFHIKELQTRVKTLIQQRKNLKKQFSTATYFKPSAIAASSVDQTFLKNAIGIIENHLNDEHFRVEHFAELLNMSISQLNRKLNALVDQPAGTFIRSLRLQRSAELLNQTDKTIAEVCYEVGFNDQAYFSRAFKKQYGKSPSAFRKLSI